MAQKKLNPAAGGSANGARERSAAQLISPEHMPLALSNQELERIAVALATRHNRHLGVVRAHCAAAGLGREDSV
jgi:hypothetical protein